MFDRMATRWDKVTELLGNEHRTPEAHHEELAAGLIEYRKLMKAHVARSTEDTFLTSTALRAGRQVQRRRSNMAP